MSSICRNVAPLLSASWEACIGYLARSAFPSTDPASRILQPRTFVAEIDTLHLPHLIMTAESSGVRRSTYRNIVCYSKFTPTTCSTPRSSAITPYRPDGTWVQGSNIDISTHEYPVSTQLFRLKAFNIQWQTLQQPSCLLVPGMVSSQPAFNMDHSNISRRRRWHWILLRLLNDGHLVDAKPIHSILNKAIGRVQHRISVCQARSHCLWHRISLDLGSHLTAVKHRKSINHGVHTFD